MKKIPLIYPSQESLSAHRASSDKELYPGGDLQFAHADSLAIAISHSSPNRSATQAHRACVKIKQTVL
jgi:hypothetical protein